MWAGIAGFGERSSTKTSRSPRTRRSATTSNTTAGAGSRSPTRALWSLRRRSSPRRFGNEGRTSELHMASEPRKRTWVWFFGVLAVLSLAAIIVPLVVVPMVHGLVPVTRENFDAARQRWERSGIRDYDLDYRKKGSAT